MKNKENLYASIPYVDKKVSRIFAGTAFSPIQDGADGTDFFEAALANGINAFDTARVYMEAEHSFGNWLEKSGRREEVVILSKCGHPDAMWNKRVNEKEMRKDLKKSLEELKTDYIDIYFYHRDNEEVPVSELIDIMEDFKKQGKIRYYACSNWTTTRMKEADAYAVSKGYRGFVANEALYNIGEPWMKPMADDTLVIMDEEMQKYHEENPRNLAMPYSAACNGFFHKLFANGRSAVSGSEYYTEGNLRNAERLHELMEEYGISVTQAVLGYLTCQKFTCLPLYGPRNIADLKEAMETFRIPFRMEDYPQK